MHLKKFWICPDPRHSVKFPQCDFKFKIPHHIVDITIVDPYQAPKIAESFIIEHKGAAYLPEQLVADRNDNQLLKVEGAPEFSRDLYAVYLSHSKRLDVILDIMKHLQLG